MPSKRTENRIKRRNLLREIIDNFISIYSKNDTELERVPMLKLNNIKLDTCDFLKWLGVEQRYVSQPYIYAKHHDDTVQTC